MCNSCNSVFLLLTYIFCLSLYNAAIYQPLSFVRLIDVVDSPNPKLVFTWSPVAPGYPNIHYNIQSLNCGDCLPTTNTTMAICSNLQLSSSAVMCTFNIQSVVCGDKFDSILDPTVVMLKGKHIRYS